MSFTAQKLDWIERVVRDQTLPPSAYRVATLIGLHYLNRNSGDAWPSQSKLAADLGVSRRTIQYALDALEPAGHLVVKASRGRVNHYRPVSETENVSIVPPIEDQTCVTDDAPIAAKAEPVPAQPVAHLGQTPAQPVAHPPAQNHSHMNPLKENPLKEKNPLKSISVTTGSDFLKNAANGFQAENKPMPGIKPQAVVLMAATPIPPSSAAPPFPKPKQERRPMNISIEDYSSFDIWWQVYPKKAAKFEAAKAYGNVLKSGMATHEVLLAGAQRYAAEQAGQDPKYTKHPATWLNKGCWLDEAAPPSGLAKPGSVYAGIIKEACRGEQS